MRRYVPLLALLILGFGTAACSDDNTPTGPSPESERYTATLLPANEVPPITGNESTGSATAELTFKLTKDAGGTITAATLDVTVSAKDFPPGTTLTSAHIHPGGAGANGGVFVSLGLSAGEVSFANGSGSFSKNGDRADRRPGEFDCRQPGGLLSQHPHLDQSRTVWRAVS